MSVESKEVVVLDTSNQLCPMPVIRAKQAIDKLASGQVLKIIATDPGSQADIPGWARVTGNTLLESGKEDGKFIFLVKKS